LRSQGWKLGVSKKERLMQYALVHKTRQELIAAS